MIQFVDIVGQFNILTQTTFILEPARFPRVFLPHLKSTFYAKQKDAGQILLA